MARPFKAKYDGWCPECKDEISAGDDVVFNDADKVAHLDCVEVREEPKQPQICPTCHLAKPCDCGEDPWLPSPRGMEIIHANGAARGFFAPEAVGDFFGQPMSPSDPRVAAQAVVAAETIWREHTGPDGTARAFFADAREQQHPAYETLEEEVEAKVPRDQWDRPLIMQPNGKRLAYNRASSYGEQIEDKSNIARWQQQQVVRGIAMHPELLNAVPEAAKGDPWADLDQNDKKALTRIADQAQEYAGSNLKSQLGTDIHYATELVDTGQPLEETLKAKGFEGWRLQRLIERGNAYWAFVKDYGFKFTRVEGFGVQDDLLVAGTIDRLGYIPWRAERQSVIDVKTSSSMDFAGVGFSVQLATYAHMLDYDPATDERADRGDIHLDEAWIIHVDRNEGGHVSLARVDIDWGWRHAMLARSILVARREGKRGKVVEIDQREAMLWTVTTRAGLVEMGEEIKSWPRWLRAKADARWRELQ